MRENGIINQDDESRVVWVFFDLKKNSWRGLGIRKRKNIKRYVKLRRWKIGFCAISFYIVGYILEAARIKKLNEKA